MNLARLIVVAFVIAWLHVPAATAQAARNGSVSGQVKDSDGFPVAGCVVTLQPDTPGTKPVKKRDDKRGRRTVTDRQGIFRFDDVPPGNYLLVMGDKWAGWVLIPIVVEAGKETKVAERST